MLLAKAIAFLCLKLSLAIIGGRPAQDYPFFALVHRGNHRCGGTVVAKDVVITAAHCLYVHTELRWATALEVYVLHGYLSRADSWDLRYHSCNTYTVHFRYDPVSAKNRGLYDAALIKLEDEVHIRNASIRTIIKVCRIDNDKWKKHKFGIGIGLGLTHENPVQKANNLMEAVFERIDCSDFGVKAEESCGQYCYISPYGSLMTKGDFGGPIIYRTRDKGFFNICLIGISSFPAYSRSKNFLTNIFTSAGILRPWVNKVVKEMSPKKSDNEDSFR